MKHIELPQGKYAIVDDKNYEWLSRYKWYAMPPDSSGTIYAFRSAKINNKWQLSKCTEKY